jgi:hypothetical protein
MRLPSCVFRYSRPRRAAEEAGGLISCPGWAGLGWAGLAVAWRFWLTPGLIASKVTLGRRLRSARVRLRVPPVIVTDCLLLFVMAPARLQGRRARAVGLYARAPTLADRDCYEARPLCKNTQRLVRGKGKGAGSGTG